MTALLEVKDLQASYGQNQVLHDISFYVDKGEAVALLGSNGAGKTTTLSCLAGIHKQKSGSVYFADINLSSLKPHELVGKGLALVPEGRKIFPHLTVRENLLLGAYTVSSNEKIDSNLNRCYELFPILKNRVAQLGGTLSGGEQQMLAISRALMSEPQLLLLDEPSMGIAPLLVKKIFEALTELKKSGVTILLVEQNAHSALECTSRAYVIESGKITLSGNSQELRHDSRIVEAYLGA